MPNLLRLLGRRYSGQTHKGCQLISPEERTDWAQGKDDNYTKEKSHSIGAPLTLAY